MSKYTKVNILEAKVPPVNKYDWWYDTNTAELKKYEGGVWNTLVATGGKVPPPSGIDCPYNIPSNEVHIYVTGHYYSDYIMDDPNYGLENFTENFVDHVFGGYYDVIFDSEDDRKIIVKWSGSTVEFIDDDMSSVSLDPISMIIFPENVRELPIEKFNISVDRSAEPVHLIFTSTEKVVLSAHLIKIDEDNMENTPIYITSYSHSLPITTDDYPIINSIYDPYDFANLYVQPFLVEDCKNEEYLSVYTINPIIETHD